MISSPKLSTYLGILLLFLAASTRCAGQAGIGALHIGAGTTWVSTPDTYVVLDKMDLQYDADPVLLNNVFRFTGYKINTIRGDSRPLIYAIGVNKGDPGMLKLNQAVTIAGRVNFEEGFFNLNGNALFLQPNAVFTNESNNNQLTGPFGGYVTIDAELHAGITANPGRLGAVITPATDLGKVTITRGAEVQYPDSSSFSIMRWYDIEPPVGTTVDATFRFYYFDNEAEGFMPDSLVLYQGADESPWTDIGYTSRDGSQFYVEKQGLTSLGRFTLANPSTSTTTPPPPPPPPTGSSGPMLLTGAWSGSLALLDWTITAEYQDQLFSIERKYASQSGFEAVGSVATKAPGGTSATAMTYAYTDSTVRTSPDDVSYRIRLVSAGGQSEYSNTITLKAFTDSTSEFIHKLYPTIAIGGRVYIEVGNMPLDKISFVVVDAKGSIVLTGELPYQSQWLPVHFLGKGVYRVVIQSHTHKWHATFIR